VQLVGDDIFVTNPERLRRGIRRDVGNAILIKVNQIGTLTETLDTMAMAREAGYACVDVAPLGRDRGHDDRRPRRRARARADQDRRPSRTDRVAKYNQLLRIEEELGDRGGLSRLGRFPRFATVRAASYAGLLAIPRDEDRRHDRAASSSRRALAARGGRRAAELSHGTHEEHARARIVRRGESEVGRPIA
jgi:hypothetical protein